MFFFKCTDRKGAANDMETVMAPPTMAMADARFRWKYRLRVRWSANVRDLIEENVMAVVLVEF